MTSSDPKPGPKPGPPPPAPESPALPPSTWAKRTGFRPKFSGETTASASGQLSLPAAAQSKSQPDLEAGQPRLLRPPPVSAAANGATDKDKNDKPPPPPPPPPQRQQPPSAAAPVKRRRDSDGRSNGPGSGDPVRRTNRVEAGAYTYKGCDPNVPVSNVVSSYCRKYMTRMKYCRVDTSQALRSAPWFRFPYPLQWGVPIFTWKMSVVMCVVSIIASVDSVGSYHASSLLAASMPPTPGVVSRAIGLEGFASVLAGLWGTGAGSTTLTENVHTIAVAKMGSRRVVELGACVLVVLSLVGKVGGFIASIPQVMVGSLLCFMWAMFTALGLSNLRYSEAGSSRNIIIVGLSLFFSLSVPAYFQQYGVSPNSNLSVPSYYQPYIVASHGPFKSQYKGVNYVMNTLLSMNMVIAFIMAVVLDNTVPGSKQERGVYVWSDSETVTREPALAKDYELPFRVGRFFRWVKWVGI